jgi:hypothetical protein
MLQHDLPPEGGLIYIFLARYHIFYIQVSSITDQIKALQFPERLLFKKSATTYSPTIAVPSALTGLTSLFGMGRGGTPPL